MLRNPAASIGCRVAEGETGEVPDSLGQQLVSQGLAICLDQPTEPAPVVRAVPESPAIAEAMESQIKPAAVRKTKPAILQVQPRK